MQDFGSTNLFYSELNFRPAFTSFFVLLKKFKKITHPMSRTQTVLYNYPMGGSQSADHNHEEIRKSENDKITVVVLSSAEILKNIEALKLQIKEYQIANSHEFPTISSYMLVERNQEAHTPNKNKEEAVKTKSENKYEEKKLWEGIQSISHDNKIFKILLIVFLISLFVIGSIFCSVESLRISAKKILNS